MNDYERALHAARQTSVIMPEFETIAAASDRDRERWTDEDHDARTRARRWLLLAAGVWLSLPPLTALEMRWHDLGYDALTALPAALVLLWASRLVRDQRFRSAILTRAMAGLNLLVALAFSFSGLYSWCLISVLIALILGRSLQLLGERDLDGSEDPESSFVPIKFRGILILALVMASADALTLLAAITLGSANVAWMYLVGGFDVWSAVLPALGWTAGATLLMFINVWGLLRLRTWALFTSMLTNLGIAALAVSGMLATGSYVVIMLVATAGIQLLLPLPILATALGWDGARRSEWVWPVFLRVIVPALVLATIVSASIHFISIIPW